MDRSPSTVRNTVASLRALIAFAELRGWVHVNPSDGLRPPTGETKRDRIASAAEAAALIKAMRSTDRAALGCAVYGGLRLGEPLALDVAAVDLEGGWLHVHRSWDRSAKEFVSVKNRKPRKVPIIEKLASLLADHFVLLDHPTEDSFSRAPTGLTGQLTPVFSEGERTSAGRRQGSLRSVFMRLGIPTQASPSQRA